MSPPCRWSASDGSLLQDRADRQLGCPCRRAAAPARRRRCAGRTHRDWAVWWGARRAGTAPSASSRWVLRRSKRSRWASTIAPRAAVISSAPVSSNAHRYWVKISAASPSTLPLALACARPVNPATETLPMPGDEQNPEADAGHDRRDALSANGFHQRFGQVDADQHQHEQEQHHHRAGVDDHLHDAEEQRVLRDVEHRQRRSSCWPGTSPSRPPSARPPRRSRRPARRAPSTQNSTASAVEVCPAVSAVSAAMSIVTAHPR